MSFSYADMLLLQTVVSVNIHHTVFYNELLRLECSQDFQNLQPTKLQTKSLNFLCVYLELQVLTAQKSGMRMPKLKRKSAPLSSIKC